MPYRENAMENKLFNLVKAIMVLPSNIFIAAPVIIPENNSTNTRRNNILSSHIEVLPEGFALSHFNLNHSVVCSRS